MRDGLMTTMTKSVALTVVSMVAMVSLTACESTSNWLKGRKTAEADSIILGAPEANIYLSDMYSLVNGDPATQAEIYADTKSRAQLTPDTMTKLRFALVLAAPGHAETNELEAQSLFRELLSRPELMSSAETALATIHLQEVEQRLVLRSEIERIRSASSRAASSSSTEDAAIAQRIATVEADNRRLRQSLAEAESKLEAITNIERSIRGEQPEGN